MLHHCGTRSLPFIFAFLPSVWANYYIDDTNTTLIYSSGPKAAWAPYAAGGDTLELLLPNGTYQVIDAYVCWNHTYRYAACFDTDSCLLTIPFTGSGITIFVYQAGPVGINASISIDGAHAQTNVLSAPPAPTYEIANVSMFDIQQLASGSHTLDLLVNDLSGSYSGMMFDYAYVNESMVANSTTTSVTATSTGTVSTSTSTPSSGSNTNIGAIVGGVIAGVGVVVAGALAFVWARRRHRRPPEMIGLRSASASPPFNPNAAYDPPFSNPAQAYDPYARYNPSTSDNLDLRHNHTPSRNTDLSSNIPLVPNRLILPDIPRTSSSQSTGQDILTPFITASSTSNTNSSGTYSRQKTQLAVSNNISANVQPQVIHSPSSSPQDMPPSLTDEQADFINSLHQNNIPAAAIARVVERMLADRHAGIREWERETRLARTNTVTTAPPSYDSVAERGQM